MAGTLVIDTLTDGSGNTTSATATIRGSAKAWVNFTVTTTPSISASYNVSSITYVTTAQFTVNFTSGFSDANYAMVGSSTHGNINSYNYANQIREDSVRRTKTTSACPVSYYDTAGGQWNPSVAVNAHIAFYR